MGKRPFGTTLDEALWRHGSATRLAAALGISRGYLCDIRKGRCAAPRALAERISVETGVAVSVLVRKATRPQA